MPKFTVQFDIPADEYASEGSLGAQAERFAADLQSMLYDRAGQDGEPPSRDALAGYFNIVEQADDID